MRGEHRRSELLLRVGVGVLLALLLAAGIAVGAQGPSSQSKAKADAARQLAGLSLPSGATKVSSDPSKGSVLGAPPPVPVSNPKYLVDDYGYWRVPGSPSSVESFIEAHAPAAADGSFGGTPQNGVYGFGWTFRYSSEVVLRALDVEVAPAAGGGSAIRADGVAAWVPAHPSWDVVPASGRVMTVWRRLKGKHRGPITFRNPRDVGRVVHFLNGAPVIPPEVLFCPKQPYPESFKVIFQAQRSGPILASARRSGAGCGSVILSVNGRPGPALVSAYGLERLLDKLIRSKR